MMSESPLSVQWTNNSSGVLAQLVSRKPHSFLHLLVTLLLITSTIKLLFTTNTVSCHFLYSYNNEFHKRSLGSCKPWRMLFTKASPYSAEHRRMLVTTATLAAVSTDETSRLRRRRRWHWCTTVISLSSALHHLPRQQVGIQTVAAARSCYTQWSRAAPFDRIHIPATNPNKNDDASRHRLVQQYSRNFAFACRRQCRAGTGRLALDFSVNI